MKTWHIYTIIGLVTCISIMQAWTTYLTVQATAGVSIKAVQHLKKKEINKKLNSYLSTTYYWRIIPKIQMTEEYIQEEIDSTEEVKRGNVDRATVEENLHQLSGFGNILDSDEEYVGTLYETDDDVIVVTKKTKTDYMVPGDLLYIDPNNPEDDDPLK